MWIRLNFICFTSYFLVSIFGVIRVVLRITFGLYSVIFPLNISTSYLLYSLINCAVAYYHYMICHSYHYYMVSVFCLVNCTDDCYSTEFFCQFYHIFLPQALSLSDTLLHSSKLHVSTRNFSNKSLVFYPHQCLEDGNYAIFESLDCYTDKFLKFRTMFLSLALELSFTYFNHIGWRVSETC